MYYFIKYLEYIYIYTLQKNEGIKKHRERMKITITIRKTWNIGERLFKDDFRRRMKIFDSLVESTALYGTEWGWLEDRRLDGIKRK